MEKLQEKLNKLHKDFVQSWQKIGYHELEQQLNEFQLQSAKDDFWDEPQAAQEIMKQISKLQNRLSPWQKIEKDLTDIAEMLSFKDLSLKDEIAEQLEKTETTFKNLQKQLQLSGPYDDHDAIIGIYAGAGGTDAQDWAQMLMRMYARFAEKVGFEVKNIDIAKGEEAGIKSAVLDMDGDFAYGKLKNEHGVHRLVRLSPFNADHLRQTSFAKVEVLPKIEQPDELLIDPKDLKVDVFRSGGHGGQSVNTTDSAVRVTHLPTGISIVIQNERSQIQNKETALTILRSRLAQLQLEQHKDKVDEIKGPNQSAEWGNQIRNYVLHPYKQVKDLRSGYESSDPQAVLNGDLEPVINSLLEQNIT